MSIKTDKINKLMEKIEAIEIQIKENQIELLKVNSEYKKLLLEIENEQKELNYDFKK